MEFKIKSWIIVFCEIFNKGLGIYFVYGINLLPLPPAIKKIVFSLIIFELFFSSLTIKYLIFFFDFKIGKTLHKKINSEVKHNTDDVI